MAACQQVMGLPELLEQILSYSPVQQLVKISGTCSIFNSVITTSTSMPFKGSTKAVKAVTWGIGRLPGEDKAGAADRFPLSQHARLFNTSEMLKDEELCKEHGFPKLFARPVHVINPLLLDLSHPPVHNLIYRFNAAWFEFAKSYSKLHMCTKVEETVYPRENLYSLPQKATCRTMQLADPPIKEIVVVLGESPLVRDAVSSSQYPPTPDTVRVSLHRDKGVRFQDVLALFEMEQQWGRFIYLRCIEFSGVLPVTLEETDLVEGGSVTLNSRMTVVEDPFKWKRVTGQHPVGTSYEELAELTLGAGHGGARS